MGNPKVIVLPKDGTQYTIDDVTTIDLVEGRVEKVGTELDDFQGTDERAVFLRVRSDGALIIELDDGNYYRTGSGTHEFELSKYPGGFRLITVRKPAASRSVDFVISTDPNFDITSGA